MNAIGQDPRDHVRAGATSGGSGGPPQLGEGPIERLMIAVLNGELPLAVARSKASSSDVVALLSPAYVEDLARFAEDSLRQGASQPALLLVELLASAAVAGRDAPVPAPGTAAQAARAVFAYIEVARGYLTDVPDGRLFHRALQLGRDEEQIARTTGDTRLLGSLLHRLGTMHLDPYSARRTLTPGDTTQYQDQHLRWLANAHQGADDFRVSVDGDDAAMPEPVEAMRAAEGLLGEAAGFREGDGRGRSLKAEAEAMLWRQFLGDPVDDQAIVGVLREALAGLAWDRDPQLRLTVLNALAVKGQEIDTNEVDHVFERSLDSWLHGLGAVQALDLIRQSYRLLLASRPREALRLLDEGRPISEGLGEEALTGHLLEEITLLSRLAPEDDRTPAPGQFDAAVQRLLGRYRDEDWDVERLFGALVSLIASTRASDEEAAGLALLPWLRANTATLLAGRHASALDWLTATLQLNTAVNGVNRGDYAAGIAGYSRALASFLKLGLARSAEDCLVRTVDLIERGEGGANVAVAAIAGVAPSALTAEQRIGRNTSQLIHRAARRILGTPPEALEPQDFLFASQVSKGLRLATALYGGSRYEWDEDEEGRRLLDAIAADSESETASWTPLDEDVLLSSYEEDVGLGEDQPVTQTPAERRAWLRRRYDSHLWDALLRNAEASEALWLQLTSVQAALDERTALISYFLGAVEPDGMVSTWAMVLTRSTVRSTLLSRGTSAITGIGPTRKAVQANPGSGNVSVEGENALALGWERFLGAGELLRDLRAQGIDHLCIVPHGPLHYYPLHLAGPADKPLADDWIVTYLSNLHLFVSRRGRPAARRHRGRALSSIGLSFERDNPHGLPPLRGAAQEAIDVAGCFGVDAVRETQATEAAVRDALENSRLVHLATHGRLDVDAPAFQCLYLTPDQTSDGCLRAHELLSMDLRGLDLVTLSACETALGRFDRSDNLRGLPAALMLSGVSSLIGTLWKVEDSTSRRFFTSLYGRLREGEHCLDAFRSAQLATRQEHPQYRDWGAFYLVGDWDWSGG